MDGQEYFQSTSPFMTLWQHALWNTNGRMDANLEICSCGRHSPLLSLWQQIVEQAHELQAAASH